MKIVLVKFCGLEGVDFREKVLVERKIVLYFDVLESCMYSIWLVVLLVGNGV